MINGGLNIKVSQISDEFEIISISLNESLGGEIATGEMSVICRPEVSTDFYDFDIELSDDSGYSKKFSAYTYSVSYCELVMTIKFICSKPEFIKESQVRSFESVLGAINANWSGELFYNEGSDIQCEIHQRSETGYQLVSKLIKCLRYYSVSGFRCDGIVVRDLNDNFDLDLSDDTFSVRTKSLTISKSKVKELEIKEEEIGVSTSIAFSHSFKQVRTEYSDLIKNYFINNSIMKILGSYRTQIQYTKFISNLEIGMVVRHKVKNLKVNKFVVASKCMSWNREIGVVTDIDLIGYDWEST